MNPKGLLRLNFLFLSGCCLLAAAPATWADSPAPPILQNGGFNTGSLSGWTTFLTVNGTVGGSFGLPNVIMFSTTGPGIPSYAAQFQAGDVVYDPQAPGGEGGGIYQTFSCVAGMYAISADVATTDITSQNNGNGGVFTLLMDQTVVAGWNSALINPGQTLRDNLSGTLFLTGGSHTLTLQVTRPAQIGTYYGQTPLSTWTISWSRQCPKRRRYGMAWRGCW